MGNDRIFIQGATRDLALEGLLFRCHMNQKEAQYDRIKKILFPVDLSETSAKLVPHVTTMAEQIGSRIHLIFVAPILDYFSTFHIASDSIDKLETELIERTEKRAKELIKGAEKRLKKFIEEHFQGFSDSGGWKRQINGLKRLGRHALRNGLYNPPGGSGG